MSLKKASRRKRSCKYQYAKARNKYMKDFDTNKEYWYLNTGT